jgi:hypothetical protein
MKNLNMVKNFYKNVEALTNFDFEALASKFASHDIFANPPVGIVTDLPFFGEVELFLVAVAMDTSKWLGRSEIAVDDGEYQYGSQVAFLAKATPILEQAGYEIFQFGPFAGMVALSGGQGCHSNLFGHPAKYYYGDGKWALKSPGEFVTGNLKAIIKDAVNRFYPDELHEYPFDPETVVEVFAQDVNKIGGYTEISNGGEAMEVYHRLSDMIYEKEDGNVNIAGYIQAGNVRYVIPAFGNNHVAFIN